MDSGVKVVGAHASDEEPPSSDAAAGSDSGGQSGGATARSRATAHRSRPIGLIAVAIAGLAGTLVFGVLWATKGGGSGQQNPSVLAASRAFLNDLTNFNAKSIDADFGSITAMATGSFSNQAKQFFNSAIRTELESALAQSQGQIRNIYVQSESTNQASVYAVVDQVYVNNKITTPQSDVLRILVDLQNVGGKWKISDVTTLEGASAATGGAASGSGSSSGSAGSTVPGQ